CFAAIFTSRRANPNTPVSRVLLHKSSVRNDERSSTAPALKRPPDFEAHRPPTMGERGPIVPRQFDVVIERDSEGYYVASVPQMPACHTQARSLDEVTERIREAIELCLELEGAPEQELEFVGIQRVTVAA